MIVFFFFFNDTATTEIYTLSLHDALPILGVGRATWVGGAGVGVGAGVASIARCAGRSTKSSRSEEHTSELQSPCNLVCRLLLEKKKKYDVDSRRQSGHHTRIMSNDIMT